MDRSNSSAVYDSTGGGRLLRGQLGGTFWGTSNYHHGPGHSVQQCYVAVHMQGIRNQAHADNCLPPPVQLHGRALPPGTEGRAMCQVQWSRLAGAPPLGPVGPTCGDKGGGRCLSTWGHVLWIIWCCPASCSHLHMHHRPLQPRWPFPTQSSQPGRRKKCKMWGSRSRPTYMCDMREGAVIGPLDATYCGPYSAVMKEHTKLLL